MSTNLKPNEHNMLPRIKVDTMVKTCKFFANRKDTLKLQKHNNLQLRTLSLYRS